MSAHSHERAGWRPAVRMNVTRAQRPDRVVAAEQVEQGAQGRAALRLAGRDRARSPAARRPAPPAAARHGPRGRPAACRAGRSAASQKLAGAAQAQILLGDAKAVLGLAHDGEPRLGRLAERLGVEQKAGRLGGPRPTRPRSWWSWARPKRSACSITMIVAAGTSTPTSITVVATSIDSRPSAKAAIVASRSALFRRPCSKPDLAGKARAQLFPKRSSTLARSISSDSSISGHTQ